MKAVNLFFLSIVIICFTSCFKKEKIQPKGFSVRPEISTEQNGINEVNGLHNDSIKFKSRPGKVLSTGYPEYRLTPIYKVNYKKNNESFIGSNAFHTNYSYESADYGNEWHYNYLPGIEAVYGYNMINIFLFNTKNLKKKKFFKNPVLIKTLYYPTSSVDTLNYKPVKRDYYMVSVYDEDSNEDGFINIHDLRRFYLFNLDGIIADTLIPLDYSVMSSQYDSKIDYLYVFAKQDSNNNGQMDEDEEINIFWIDLKNPVHKGMQY